MNTLFLKCIQLLILVTGKLSRLCMALGVVLLGQTLALMDKENRLLYGKQQKNK